jgi:hypothetical protein
VPLGAPPLDVGDAPVVGVDDAFVPPFDAQLASASKPAPPRSWSIRRRCKSLLAMW